MQEKQIRIRKRTVDNNSRLSVCHPSLDTEWPLTFHNSALEFPLELYKRYITWCFMIYFYASLSGLSLGSSQFADFIFDQSFQVFVLLNNAPDFFKPDLFARSRFYVFCSNFSFLFNLSNVTLRIMTFKSLIIVSNLLSLGNFKRI